MTRMLPRIAALIAMAISMAACWQQDDVISIAPDGHVDFTSSIVVTDDELTFEQVEEVSSDFISDISKSGWNITKKWTSKEWPYRLEVSGNGNIFEVKENIKVFGFEKDEDGNYFIRFIPITNKDDNRFKSSNRSVTFTTPPSGHSPQIVDSNGIAVTRIDDVNAKTKFRLVFKP